MVRRHWCAVRIGRAVSSRVRVRARRIRGRRRAAKGRIELGQSVERLVGITIVGPVFAEFAEVVIKGAVFLREKDDVIDGRIESRGDRFCAADHDRASGRGAGTCTAPPSEDGEGRRCSRSFCENDLRSAIEICGASSGTVDSGGRADDGSSRGVRDRHGDGY